MAIRPELKTIKDAIKVAPKHYIKLERPIPIEAGTRWKYTGSSGTYNGQFKYKCKIIAVREGINGEVVLDRKSSISDECLKDCGALWEHAKDPTYPYVNRKIFHGSLSESVRRLCANEESLRSLDTSILKQIADQLKA